MYTSGISGGLCAFVVFLLHTKLFVMYFTVCVHI